MMNDAVRAALVRLCAEHGPGLLDDPVRLEGLLRDTCPGSRREVYCLLNAVQTGVLGDLRRAVREDPVGNHGTQNAAVRLRADLGFDQEAAEWTAQCLWQALGGRASTVAFSPVPPGAPLAGPGSAGPPPKTAARARRSQGAGEPPAPASGWSSRRRLILAAGVAAAVLIAAAVLVVLSQRGGPTAAGQSATVSVSPGGSPTLEDALAQVEDGGTVRLSAGSYRVSSLVISASVKLVGDGAELTTVILDSGEQPGVSISGRKDVVATISGVTLRQLAPPSEAAGDVVAVGGSARAVLRDCRLEGGGHGLGCYGSGTVETHRCRISGAYRSVVNAADRSRLSMEGSSAVDSLEGRGLCAKGSARVIVDGGSFSGNYGDGLLALDSARVVITGSVVSENEHGGLSAKGTARMNVTGVRASLNGLVAVGYSHSSSGFVKGCDLASGQTGRTPHPCISVSDQAETECVENACANARGFGIYYSGQSTGRVTGNDCARCARGIGVEGAAQPSVGSNQAGVAHL